jgi:hypothetical protein
MQTPVFENDSLERPKQTSVPMMLAEQVLSLFEQSGTTPREQNAAIDIVRTIVMDRLFSINCRSGQPTD